MDEPDSKNGGEDADRLEIHDWRSAHLYRQKGRDRLVTSILVAIHSDVLDDDCERRHPVNSQIDTC